MISLVLLMRALKNVVVRFLGKEVSCMALFDTGSGVTAVQRSFFEESFGAKWSTLDRRREGMKVNTRPERFRRRS